MPVVPLRPAVIPKNALRKGIFSHSHVLIFRSDDDVFENI